MDTELLETLPEDILSEFFHNLVDDICNLNGNRPSAKEIFIPSIWPDESSFEATQKEWAPFLVRLSLESQRKSDTLDRLPEKLKKVIKELMEVRRSDLRHALISLTSLTTTGLAADKFLMNFNWHIEYVLSSDRMSSINEPIVTLHLHSSQIDPQSGSQKDGDQLDGLTRPTASSQLTIELKSSDLRDLIYQLENAQSTILKTLP